MDGGGDEQRVPSKPEMVVLSERSVGDIQPKVVVDSSIRNAAKEGGSFAFDGESRKDVRVYWILFHICCWIPNSLVLIFPAAAGATAAGRTRRSQLDPSHNAPRNQIRRKEPLLRSMMCHPKTLKFLQYSYNANCEYLVLELFCHPNTSSPK